MSRRSTYSRASLVVLASLVHAFTLCAASAENAEASAVDSSGAIVRLGRAASRIVALSPGAVESIFAIGAGKQIAYRGAECDYPDEAGAILPYSSASSDGIDLFIVDDLSQLGPELSRQSGTPVFVYAPNDFKGLADAVMALGVLTGHAKDGVRVAAGITNAVLRVRSFVSRLPAASYPRVFWEAHADPLETCGSGSFAQALIAEAGGRKIFSVRNGAIDSVSEDEIIARDPQAIVIASRNGTEEMERWAQTQAGQSDSIIVVDPQIASRASPRSPSLLLRLARAFHPGLVP